MTRKRRLKRRSRLTQRGLQRKSKRRIHRGGGAQKPVINLCIGLPYPVNGLEYTTKTEEIVRGQSNPDYKSYFDSNCKPLYYVSTSHYSKSAEAKFMILKNPGKVTIVVNKWIALLEPIKAKVLGSSKLEMVSMTNVNPFMDYYAQLQRYKSLFENKSMMSTRSGTNLLKAAMTVASTMGKSSDTEALYSDETIMDTFNGITQQYKYYSDMPFNIKEFLGFEGIGGWLGTEASRQKSMIAVDNEVAMLVANTPYTPSNKTPEKEAMEKERDLKIQVAKRALVLCLYVFCYLNYMPIPKGKMDEDTINRMIQTLNTFYKQINTFSGGGAPKDVEKLLIAYVDGFKTNLEDLTKEMEKKRAKPIVGGAAAGDIELSTLTTRHVPSSKPSNNKTPLKKEVQDGEGGEGPIDRDLQEELKKMQVNGTPEVGTSIENEHTDRMFKAQQLYNVAEGAGGGGSGGGGEPVAGGTGSEAEAAKAAAAISASLDNTTTFAAAAKNTEQAAKDYKPVVPTISVEKKSGKYAIAEKELREAIELYEQDKNDIHEQIVTARYQKLLDIAEEDIQTAEKQQVDFPEKYKDKVDQRKELQTALEGWTVYRGEKKDKQKFNPDELDGKILTLKISIQENKKELDVIKKEIPGVLQLDDLVLAEEAAMNAFEKAKAEKKDTILLKLASSAATEEVTKKVTQLKLNKDEQNRKEIDRYVKLLSDNASKERKKDKFQASSNLQRGFLSETLSYEKTIAYLYRPKETTDPLKEFYAAITNKDGTKTMEHFYEFIDKNVKDTDGNERKDLLDGDENVSDQVLKDYVQANEGENKMRARTHFFMKVLYAFAKDLQKMIKHADKTRFAMNIHNFKDNFNKNRLKNMKEYLKERSRSETLFSMYPASLDPPGAAGAGADPGAGTTDAADADKDVGHQFVRLYNSAEYPQANRMFSLKEAKLEHVFSNTAYFDGHGFVFIQDPAKYRGLFVKYYYDENDYLVRGKMGRPDFEEKEVVKGFLQFGQPKGEKKPKDAYKELNPENKGILAQVRNKVKNYNYAMTTEGIERSVATATLAPRLALKGYKDVALDKVANKENAEERGRELEKKLDEVARKEQVRVAMTGGGVAQKKRTESGKMAGVTGGVMLGALGGIAGTVLGTIGSAFTFSFLAISVAFNVVINSVLLTSYVSGKVSGYFNDLADSSSYLNLGKLADTKSAECKKIVKMLAMNCEQEKDQRANQLLLSVLSNLYNAVDYIQKAEEKFHDRREYNIELFKGYIESLVKKIKDNPVEFGNQSLYKSMNEPKKMLYFVYAILQNCKPKTLAEAKTEMVSGIQNSKGELSKKIEDLNKKRTELKSDIDALKLKTGFGTNPEIATKEKKYEELEKEIEKLETTQKTEIKAKKIKGETEDLDKEIGEEEKTAEQTLKKNEKPIKELLKKNPPIKFDMKDVMEMFEKPTAYLYTRYSGIKSGQEMTKTVTLMDGVNMLVPTHLPAAASVFVYKTGQKNEEEMAKEEEDKKKALENEAKAKEKADRKSKEAIAKMGANAEKVKAKSAAAATVKAAQIAAQSQLRTQVPRGQNPLRGPDRDQNKQDKGRDKGQNNTERKPSLMGKFTKKIKNTAKNITNRARNVTAGVRGKLLTLLGNIKHKICVKRKGTDECYDIKTAKNGTVMVEDRPR